jgi:hypothetical protein
MWTSGPAPKAARRRAKSLRGTRHRCCRRCDHTPAGLQACALPRSGQRRRGARFVKVSQWSFGWRSSGTGEAVVQSGVHDEPLVVVPFGLQMVGVSTAARPASRPDPRTLPGCDAPRQRSRRPCPTSPNEDGPGEYRIPFSRTPSTTTSPYPADRGQPGGRRPTFERSRTGVHALTAVLSGGPPGRGIAPDGTEYTDHDVLVMIRFHRTNQAEEGRVGAPVTEPHLGGMIARVAEAVGRRRRRYTRPPPARHPPRSTTG